MYNTVHLFHNNAQQLCVTKKINFTVYTKIIKHSFTLTEITHLYNIYTMRANMTFPYNIHQPREKGSNSS